MWTRELPSLLTASLHSIYSSKNGIVSGASNEKIKLAASFTFHTLYTFPHVATSYGVVGAWSELGRPGL